MTWSLHQVLLNLLYRGLDRRVALGMDEQRLTQAELSRRSGVAQPNLSAIQTGKPATEATWEKLLRVAWPDGPPGQLVGPDSFRAPDGDPALTPP